MGLSDIDPAQMASTLRGVQELDTKIIGLLREIEGLEEKHHLNEIHAELESAGQGLAEAEAELEELEHRQHKLDGELDLLSEKIEKEESRMMSGTIMNPKELSAIQAEIFSLRKKRDEMETEDLEEMEGIDGLSERIRGSRGLIDQVTERESRAREAYADDLAEKQRQVAGLEAERDELKEVLDADTVKAYEKLLEQKDGLAVVGIVQGRSCGGCRIEFSRTQIDRFQHEEGVFRCEYCRRMLVK
jgi:predicted  nucleic acid-binding Zn-ribbon protein